MDGRSRSSPVIVGRDELLGLGERRAAAARDGTGHLLFLAGEAGIGKTRLLGALVRGAERVGLRSVAAAAFPSDLEIPGAILLDLGDQLARSGVPGWAELGDHLRARIDSASEKRSDGSHRQRRLLVLDQVSTIMSLADQGPVVIALEDLHWADDLTLQVLGQLARRLPDAPLLVIGTYRSDELFPRVPMRDWRSRLLMGRLAEEASLPRLDLEQTASLVDFLLGGPLPARRELINRLYRRTDGIPLHVEELLGALVADDRQVEGAARLPDTLADAIIQRASVLSAGARRLAATAAVIGRSFDLDLLAAVHGGDGQSVDRPLAELRQRFFLVELGRDWYDFRHALIRDAIEASIDPTLRRRLHQRVAEAASGRSDVGSHAFLSAHFELAGMRDHAFHHARLAAARAAAVSSHREALGLSRRALRTAPTALPPRELAALLRATATEEAATDDNKSAAESLEQARRVLQAAGDPTSAAELLPPLIAAQHLLGTGLPERAALIDEELAALSHLDDRATAGTRGRLLAARSAAFMLARRLDEAIADGERAAELARLEGDTATELHVAVTVGSCHLFAGRMDEGWAKVEESIRAARHGRREAEAARAYRMLGSSASVLVEYDRAAHWLEEGIEFAERTEQWNHRHYMTAHLAHVAWARGDWDRAVRLAERSLADGRGGKTTTITALHVIGYVTLGRGDFVRAEEALSDARGLGEEMGELQRVSPALWGLAEAALLQGRHVEAVELTDAGRRASAAVRDAAYLFPFLVTGTRARLARGDLVEAARWVELVSAALRERSIPGTLPAIDHALGLLDLAKGATGSARTRLTAALDGWLSRGRAWEACGATIDLAGCALRANRSADAARLVAEAVASAQAMRAAPLLANAREIEKTLRERGFRQEPWAPLTAREFEVATRIAAGRTNREIAAELTITPKTVASHVEHILGRLGAERRTEIATWVASRADQRGSSA